LGKQKEDNVEGIKGNGKLVETINVENNFSKKQSIINASLIGKRSKYTTTFLPTFEIFNTNVHNCMVDSSASSNLIP
jgi:hypothetical protein